MRRDVCRVVATRRASWRAHSKAGLQHVLKCCDRATVVKLVDNVWRLFSVSMLVNVKEGILAVKVRFSVHVSLMLP